ncbi:hypothetical protein [Rhizobium sp. SL86]|jgi:hypothetical protein|uniref:hypothetical protein n=1 Tax=Rhizobium sp. SL86 TaxID=2995148 RepID=UPI0022731B61|nr:hypothetical protein [Rhizobium sp. SL86]MCY1666937.1 hypothetical protein [Rhizobium sp. SL86]
MSKVVVIGVSGEEALWVVDIASGTVTSLEVTEGSDFAAANSLRKQGATIVKNVDLAVGVDSMETLATGHYE